MTGHGVAVAGLVLGYFLGLPMLAITVLLAANPSGVADFLSGLFG